MDIKKAYKIGIFSTSEGLAGAAIWLISDELSESQKKISGLYTYDTK